MTNPTHQVLVLDDTPEMLDFTARSLTRARFSVHGVADLGDLMEYLEVSQPQLILLDVKMPELFGDDVGSVLKRKGTNAKVYLYSSLDNDELRERADEAGVDGWISKNRGVGHLVERVGSILESG